MSSTSHHHNLLKKILLFTLLASYIALENIYNTFANKTTHLPSSTAHLPPHSAQWLPASRCGPQIPWWQPWWFQTRNAGGWGSPESQTLRGTWKTRSFHWNPNRFGAPLAESGRCLGLVFVCVCEYFFFADMYIWNSEIQHMGQKSYTLKKDTTRVRKTSLVFNEMLPVHHYNEMQSTNDISTNAYHTWSQYCTWTIWQHYTIKMISNNMPSPTIPTFTQLTHERYGNIKKWDVIRCYHNERYQHR
jgi:hypothetical protein